MLTSGLTKKLNRMNTHSMENNMASGKYYIEYISKSFENKEYIKSKVVLWKHYMEFFILFYLRKLRVQGELSKRTWPDLGAFPDIGNDVSALVAITAIAQCKIKNTSSDGFKP